MFGIVDSAGQKRFGEALNGGERRAEFVGDVGNEVAADALEFAKFGNVVQHDDRTGGFPGANGGDGGGEIMLPERTSDDFGFDARLAGENAAHGFDEFGLAHHFQQ